MKTTKKLLSMVMTMVLFVSMAVCMPVVAEDVTYTAGDNATFEMEGLSYTVEAGSVIVTEEAAFTGDTNTTPKLKITHTEDSVTTVKTLLSTAGLPDIGTLEIATDFVITEMTSGTGLTVSKIQSSNNGRPGSTAAFTKTTEYWRTAMLQNTVITSIELTITFSGVGTVYLDNAHATPCTGIFNGNFKGLTSEFKPTGWTFSGAYIENDTDFANADTAGWRLHQTKDGNYMTATKLGRSRSIMQSIEMDCLESGALYRVTLETKNDYIGINASSGCNVFPYGDWKDKDAKGYASWMQSTPDWTQKSVTYIADNRPKENEPFKVYFIPLNGVGYIRNVKMEKLEESCTLLNTEGTACNSVDAGTYTVNYSYPLADIAAVTYTAETELNDFKADAIEVNGALSTTKLRAIVAVYQETTNGKALYDIKISDEIASRVLLPALNSTEPNIGIIPASSAPITVTIPDDGQKYSIKVLGWTSISGLKAYGDGVAFPAAE